MASNLAVDVRGYAKARWALPLACFAAVAVSAWPQEARAWRCSRVQDTSGTESGSALFWSNRNISFSFNRAGTKALDQDAAFDAVRAGFAVWQNSTLADGEPLGCPGTARPGLPTATDLQFSEGPATDQNFVGFNYLSPETNRNVILFRDTGWPHPLTSPSSDLVAMTTLTYNVITGEILDADIEFNTEDFSLTVGDRSVGFDLLGAAVHEVGHLLGFDDVTVANAAMFQSTSRGETLKRRLSCDDAAILWYRYPAALATSTCKPRQIDESCGFCAAPGGLAFDAKAVVRDVYDGHSGCDCQSTSGSQSFVVAALALGWRRLRRTVNLRAASSYRQNLRARFWGRPL